ncbi:hypothetical protein [Streptomyces venezuelae]
MNLALAISAAGLLIAGCSGSDGDGYTTPSSLCGIDVPADALEPVLPDGDSISASPTSSAYTKRCRLLIDAKPVFSAAVEWWGSSTTLQRVATDAIGVDPFDRATPDHNYIYSSTGAVGSVDCPNQKDLKGKIYVSVRTADATTEEKMKKFITSYSASVASSKECTRKWGQAQ